MKRNLMFEEIFDCSVERLWRAITEPGELESWLMPNDFVAEVGHRFGFQAVDMTVPQTIECEVLELRPPTYLRLSWKFEGNPSEVIFEISPVAGGESARSQLKLSHIGIPDSRMADLLQNGWPGKLEQLDELTRSG